MENPSLVTQFLADLQAACPDFDPSKGPFIAPGFQPDGGYILKLVSYVVAELGVGHADFLPALAATIERWHVWLEPWPGREEHRVYELVLMLLGALGSESRCAGVFEPLFAALGTSGQLRMQDILDKLAAPTPEIDLYY